VQQFNLRVQDLAGNWSKPVSTAVTVQRPNAIFSDAFGSGTLSAWSAATGGVSAAGQALKVTLPGGRNNRASFVTDASPAGETGYHARFSFSAGTLNAGTGATLTLFDGRTAAGGQVFALQHRTVNGAAQVRTVLSRSGTTALNGAWVPLTTGSHVLQVDWTAGPATGASAGSLRLAVDGAVRSTTTGNTSTLRVDTVRLGVVAGFTTTAATTGSTSGTATFDDFVSTRHTLP
jgi:hypothetical protein